MCLSVRECVNVCHRYIQYMYVCVYLCVLASRVMGITTAKRLDRKTEWRSTIHFCVCVSVCEHVCVFAYVGMLQCMCVCRVSMHVCVHVHDVICECGSLSECTFCVYFVMCVNACKWKHLENALRLR